MQIFLIDFLY